MFADTDACVSPVLDASEARDHPHNAHRRLFTTAADAADAAAHASNAPPASSSAEVQEEWRDKCEEATRPVPSAAPRLSRTPGSAAGARPVAGSHTWEVLCESGVDREVAARVCEQVGAEVAPTAKM